MRNKTTDEFIANANKIHHNKFNGDLWHGNPKIFKQEEINTMTKTTYGFLYQRTLLKEQSLKSAGYNVISIWESDFDKA